MNAMNSKKLIDKLDDLKMDGDLNASLNDLKVSLNNNLDKVFSNSVNKLSRVQIDTVTLENFLRICYLNYDYFTFKDVVGFQGGQTPFEEIFDKDFLVHDIKSLIVYVDECTSSNNIFNDAIFFGNSFDDDVRNLIEKADAYPLLKKILAFRLVSLMDGEEVNYYCKLYQDFIISEGDDKLAERMKIAFNNDAIESIFYELLDMKFNNSCDDDSDSFYDGFNIFYEYYLSNIKNLEKYLLWRPDYKYIVELSEFIAIKASVDVDEDEFYEIFDFDNFYSHYNEVQPLLWNAELHLLR